VEQAVTTTIAGIERAGIERLLGRERAAFVARCPRSRALAAQGGANWLGGVPMHWMADWGTPFPLHVASATGAELEDADGNRYVDFCLGDTGAMFGHSPPPVAEAIARQSRRGLTTMLPGEDAAVVGRLLAERFGLPCWQVAQTASDANRAVLRWARAVTGRPAVLVFDRCYHGMVDDTFVGLDESGRVRNRPGLVGQAADLSLHTRCVEFNDLAALEAALKVRDVACVLAEPVMTNAGMVLPEPGFLDRLRALTRRHGTLLAIDETHTLSSGLGGYSRLARLEPDFLVAGKAIAGGFPCAVYGFTAEVETRIRGVLAVKPAGHSGIGTTLAGNPLAMAALRASLEQVMTEASCAHMVAMAERLEDGLEQLVEVERLPWHVQRVGARLEVGFTRRPPRTGRESIAGLPPLLPEAIRLYLLNRGLVITPFHNMMLMSPATPAAAVDRLYAAWAECVTDLQRAGRGDEAG
jgi:glutamate-1-semialdehyde 2,1-aminomutase